MSHAPFPKRRLASLLALVFSLITTVHAPAASQSPMDMQGAVVAIAGDKKVELSWQPAGQASSYCVYVAPELHPSGVRGTPGEFHLLAETSTNSYVDTGLNNGYYYFYKVAALDPNGQENWLNEVPVAVKPYATGDDTSPPELVSLTVPELVHIGQEFTVTAEIYDDISGVCQGGTINGISSGQVQIRVEPVRVGSHVSLDGIFQFDPVTKKWTARVTVPQNSPTGTWKVYSVFLVDWVGNSQFLHPGQTFTVAPDETVPSEKPVPILVTSDPQPGASGVEVNRGILLSFDVAIEEGNVYDTITLRDANGNVILLNKSIADRVLTVHPVHDLAYSTRYTVTIPATAIRALGGEFLPKDISLNFTTRAAPSRKHRGINVGGISFVNMVEKNIETGKTTIVEMPGRVKVKVPPEAITGANVTIKVEAVDNDTPHVAGAGLLSRVMSITLRNGALTSRITITLYFEKSKLDKDQEPAVFYYNEEQSNWVRLEGTVDLDEGTVTVVVDHLTLFAVFAVNRQSHPTPVVIFEDVHGHWAAGTVSKLAGMGIISGYPDGTFRPDNPITRVEIASMLVRALKLAPADDSTLPFADTNGIPVWARGDVAAVARHTQRLSYSRQPSF